MKREQLPPHKSATFVLPRHKVVYVSVPKAACTSMKWLVAELQDEAPARFHRVISREVGRSLTLHRRRLWRNTPMLHELTDEQLAAISPGSGWFVFAVVRHPSARLWAAWQSKFLLGDPRFHDEYSGEPWLPRVPAATADVTEDFTRFAESLAADPGQRVLQDRHFMPQRALITPATTPYSRVYDTTEIPGLLADLATHLRAQGWDGELALRRSNETPLAPLRSLFTPALTDAIESVYRDDFETFGYADPVPAKTDPAAEYPREALVAIGLLAERGERVGDLALRAKALAERDRRLRERVRSLRGRVKRLRAANADLRKENAALRGRRSVRSVVRRALRGGAPAR
jgi:hypothetical protein